MVRCGKHCCLERASDAEAGDAVHRTAEQFLVGEAYRAGGPDQAGDRVDERGLARPVRTDEEAEVARGDVEVHAVDGRDTVEDHPQVTDPQSGQVPVGHTVASPAVIRTDRVPGTGGGPAVSRAWQ